MDLRPKMKINTVAWTKFGVYTIHAMEQSLVKHKNYITELREENIY